MKNTLNVFDMRKFLNKKFFKYLNNGCQDLNMD